MHKFGLKSIQYPFDCSTFKEQMLDSLFFRHTKITQIRINPFPVNKLVVTENFVVEETILKTFEFNNVRNRVTI